MLPRERDAILHRPRRQIILQHEHVVPDIQHRAAIPVRLRDIEIIQLIDRERHRVRQHRFRRDHIHLELPGERELLDIVHPFIRSGGDHGERLPVFLFRLGIDLRRRCRQHTGKQSTCQHPGRQNACGHKACLKNAHRVG